MACKNGQNPDQKSGKTDVLNPFTQSRRIQNQTTALFHTLPYFCAFYPPWKLPRPEILPEFQFGFVTLTRPDI